MIWGSFGREGSCFLENAGRIDLPARQQRHLPQTLCHIIGMWKSYKFGMVRLNQKKFLQFVHLIHPHHSRICVTSRYPLHDRLPLANGLCRTADRLNPTCIYQEEGPLPFETTPNHSKNDRFPSSERVKQVKKVNFPLFILAIF